MKLHQTRSTNLKNLANKLLSVKACFLSVLIILSGIHVSAQGSSDTAQQKKTVYLLPDGREFSLNKWDSLEQAWGKGRVRLRHSREDDANGIVHLERLTDEIIQQSANRDRETEQALTALLNKPAPEFALTDIQGKQWSLKKLHNKIVVLNFWFVSCTPCIAEMPELNKLAASYAPEDVVFLGLTFNSKEQVQMFLKKYKFEYRVLPGSGNVDKIYHINTWPTSIVISKKGEIKKIVHSTPNIREELRVVIDKLM